MNLKNWPNCITMSLSGRTPSKPMHHHVTIWSHSLKTHPPCHYLVALPQNPRRDRTPCFARRTELPEAEVDVQNSAAYQVSSLFLSSARPRRVRVNRPHAEPICRAQLRAILSSVSGRTGSVKVSRSRNSTIGRRLSERPVKGGSLHCGRL
jgi:hypothetical protein